MKLIPLLTIPLALYVVGAHWQIPYLDFTLDAYGSVKLPSGAVWTIHGFDVFAVVSILFLILEITKNMSYQKRSLATMLFEHIFSTVLCVVCMVLFLMVGRYGTSHILLLAVFALCDVITGVLISERLQRSAAGVKA